MDAGQLVDCFSSLGCRLVCGVPDSLLSKFSAAAMGRHDLSHIICANEGNAVGLAIGNYLSTGSPAVVYMQNSGLGNSVNPLVSLADPAVYGIPLFLVIGLRGEPGLHDEPQHVQQGAVTTGLLNVLGIPYAVLSAEADGRSVTESLWKTMCRKQCPVALVVRKNVLAGDYPVAKVQPEGASLMREEALKILVSSLPEDSFLIATTGKTGRELFEIREHAGEAQRDFLTVGGMGHASSIALGVALQRKNHWTVCLDGDGAVLMHMGAMASLCEQKPERYLHVILNNQAHESVGGQPTGAVHIRYQYLAKAFGYTGFYQASSKEEILDAISSVMKAGKGTWLLEIRLRQGARKDLGRPTKTPEENKEAVMQFLQQDGEQEKSMLV